MKTTVEIPDALFREAKRYAIEHDVTFREVVEAGLRNVVQQNSGRKKTFKLKKCAFKGEGPVKDFTWPELRAMIYQGRGE